MKLNSARLFFFSPTGSTEKIVKSIVKGLDINDVKITGLTSPQTRKNLSNNFKNCGMTNDIINDIINDITNEVTNIKTSDKESVNESSEVLNKNISKKLRITVEEDIAIIGVPVYVQQIPYFLNECLKNIDGNGKPAILVCVYGNINSGIALKQLYTLAQKCHFTVTGAAEFIARHSFCNEQIHVAENRPDTKDLIIAENFGKAVKIKLLGLDTSDKKKTVYKANYLSETKDLYSTENNELIGLNELNELNEPVSMPHKQISLPHKKNNL